MIFLYYYHVLVYIGSCHSMCHMIVGVGFPAGSGVGGGSRSPQSGLLRMGLHERGHFGKVGLGWFCCRSFRITGLVCPSLVFRISL